MVFTAEGNFMLATLRYEFNNYKSKITATSLRGQWVNYPGCRDHIVYEPSQWATTLQCNVVAHWLGAHTKWSLSNFIASMLHQYISRTSNPPRQIKHKTCIYIYIYMNMSGRMKPRHVNHAKSLLKTCESLFTRISIKTSLWSTSGNHMIPRSVFQV